MPVGDVRQADERASLRIWVLPVGRSRKTLMKTPMRARAGGQVRRAAHLLREQDGPHGRQLLPHRQHDPREPGGQPGRAHAAHRVRGQLPGRRGPGRHAGHHLGRRGGQARSVISRTAGGMGCRRCNVPAHETAECLPANQRACSSAKSFRQARLRRSGRACIGRMQCWQAWAAHVHEDSPAAWFSAVSWLCMG